MFLVQFLLRHKDLRHSFLDVDILGEASELVCVYVFLKSVALLPFMMQP